MGGDPSGLQEEGPHCTAEQLQAADRVPGSLGDAIRAACHRGGAPLALRGLVVNGNSGQNGVFAGFTGTATVGLGGTASVGVFTNGTLAGSGFYAHGGAGGGYGGVSGGVEIGRFKSPQALKGPAVEVCTGRGISSACTNMTGTVQSGSISPLFVPELPTPYTSTYYGSYTAAASFVDFAHGLVTQGGQFVGGMMNTTFHVGGVPGY